uniref:Uncharacterized protein n=1 Tax=Pinguiococcus pyrenoidosus TaxID=172671 RepID=A0A7R9Y939_9STRA
MAPPNLPPIDTATPKPDAEKPKYDNWFYRNPGYTFLAIVLSIIGALVRSSYSVADRNRIEEEVESLTAVEPEEIAEINRANAVSAETFAQLVKEIVAELGVDDVSYPDFIVVARGLLRRFLGEERQAIPVKQGHILDRAVLGMIPRYESGGQAADQLREDVLDRPSWDGLIGLPGPSVLREKLPLRSLLVALSLIVDSNVLDTSDAYHEMLRVTSSSQAVGLKDVEELVDALQLTAQIPCYVQVVKADEYVPYQRYRGASAQDILHHALREKPRKGEDPLIVDNPEDISVQTLRRLMMTRSICLLGQCPKV